MKLKTLFILVLGLCSVTAFAGGGQGIRFIENKGQWDKKILYRAAVPAGELFFERNCLTFNLYDAAAVKQLHLTGRNPTSAKPNLINFHAFKINFSGSNFWATNFPSEKTDDYYNYYKGKDKSRWASHVNAFQTITYTGIYDKVDLKVKARGQAVKYEFVVAPGGNTNNIVLDFEGVSGLRLHNDNLIIETSVLSLQEEKPYAYQTIDGVETAVECVFTLNGTKVAYAFPNGYDPRYELVIDPNLVFCSFSGSLADNWGYTATYDQLGNLYAGGVGFDNGYPLTTGAFQQLFGLGGCDATISKYTADGTSFTYSTYLGGSGPDQPHSMIVNSNNELYVYGTTGSADFPVTSNAYDQTFGGGTQFVFDNVIDFANGSDIYIARFKLDGTDLLACTYFGGSGNDGLNSSAILNYNYADQSRGEIFIDAFNNVIIGSSTLSTNLPITPNAYQPNLAGNQDGCLAKFDNNLSALQFATYYGGAQDDAIYSVFLDKNNTIYITGGTRSLNLPVTSGTLNPVYLGGIADAFVAHLSGNGQQLLQGTYYGSNQYDQAYFVQLDKAGNVYIVGQTEATGTALISNATFNTPGGNQFIAKMNGTLNSLTWSTAFGKAAGKPDIVPSAFLVDVCNKVYISGWGGDLFGQNINNATCTGMPISNNAFQSTTDGSDYYLMIIDDNASALVYGTYFGGPTSEEHVDGGTSRFDRQGTIYQSICAGCGGLSDLPVSPGVVSETNNSVNCNNGVFKFDFDFPLTVADFSIPLTGCAPFDITFNNLSTGAITYAWNFGDSSPTSSATNPTHTYSNPGTYIITLIAQNPANCNIADTISRQVILLGNNSSTLDTLAICPGIPIQIGIPPLSDPNVVYSWTPANLLSNAAAPNPIATISTNTLFTLIITNGTCIDTFYQAVNLSNDLPVNLGPDISLCSGLPVQLGFNDNSGLFNYLWTPSAGLNDDAISNPITSATENTTYVLNVNSISNPGCNGSDTINITITTSPPLADFEASFIASCNDLTINLDNTTNSNGPFYWSLGGGFFPGTGDTNFVVQYSTSYTITLISGNPPCSDTITKTINTLDFAGYAIANDANIFTPLNGDNINTCFSPALPPTYTGTPQEYPLLDCSKLIIYNRWGRKIWEGAGCWNGYTQSGSAVTEGVYYYIFEAGGIKKHGVVHVANAGS